MNIGVDVNFAAKKGRNDAFNAPRKSLSSVSPSTLPSPEDSLSFDVSGH